MAIDHPGQSGDVTTETVVESKCQVIPARGKPPCSRPGTLPKSRRNEPTPKGQPEKLFLCRDHRDEYSDLYRTYKDASSKVIELRRKIESECKASGEAGWGREKLDEVIATRGEYAAAIVDELEKREIHRKRFFAQADSGHAIWSRNLRRDQTANENELTRLRQRRDSLQVKATEGAIYAQRRPVIERTGALPERRPQHWDTEERRPLLPEARPPFQPSTRSLPPHVPRHWIQPYVSTVNPLDVDIERQYPVIRRIGEVETEPCLAVSDACFVLVLGLFTFLILVKVIG